MPRIYQIALERYGRHLPVCSRSSWSSSMTQRISTPAMPLGWQGIHHVDAAQTPRNCVR
jgi:2-haloacid dehalogenase